MKQDILHFFPHVELTSLALVLFFTSFVGVIVYAFHSKNKQYFKVAATLPLDED